MSLGKTRTPNAGAFSIERLEVSRFGSPPLCVLNRCEGGYAREIDADESADAVALRLGLSPRTPIPLTAGTVLGLASPRTNAEVQFPLAHRLASTLIVCQTNDGTRGGYLEI